MIEGFASAHKLNLREAEVAMLAYLRTLATKGIMTLSVTGRPENGVTRKDGQS
jgi:hypothetical protein